MVKSVGIDPGTKSMDLYGFDDETGETIIDEAIPRDEVTKSPEMVVRVLRKLQDEVGRIDVIVGPCGYGMPLKRARDATDEDIALATFVTRRDVERRLKIIGLRELMVLLRSAEDLNVWFTPGVIHLPTVPSYRKANRIDMGTADKVYTMALAIKDQAERLDISYDETSLIAVEVGFAYTSAMAVEGGRIVDGIAGTAGFPSYLGMGFMDSELAYALANTLGGFTKLLLFSGGIADVAGVDPAKTSPEEFVSLARRSNRVAKAYEMMIESIVKDVAALLPSVIPREVVLSGRFVRIPEFLDDVAGAVKEFASKLGFKLKVVKLRSRAEVAKEAAEGAALIANGIAGGKYKDLVEVMRLKESKGDIFSNIYLKGDVISRLNEFRRLIL